MPERDGEEQDLIKRILAALVIALNLAFADQVVKELAVANLKNSPPVEVIDGFFALAYVENRGCAWGMMQGQVWPLAVFALAVLAILVWKHKEVFGSGVVVPGLLYAGIAGNLIDRVFRGHVVDMFDFHWGASHFPCFNLADTYISVAVGLMLLASFLEPSVKNEK